MRSLPFSGYAAAIDALIWGGLWVEYVYVLSRSGTLLWACLGEIFLVGLLAGVAVWLLITSQKIPARPAIAGVQALGFLAFSAMDLGLLLLYNGPFDVPLAGVNAVACAVNSLAALDRWRRRYRGPRPDGHFSLGWTCLAVTALLVGWACISSFGVTLTLQAPNGAVTKSSFWGSPDLVMVRGEATTVPLDERRLLLTPERLKDGPADYGIGALATVDRVTVVRGPLQALPASALDHAAGAVSNPDGSVTLSVPLPAGTEEVTVAFAFVQNWPLLRTLSETHATLILNGYGMEDRTDSRSLFLLLDHWGIPYYLQVAAHDEYSHVFNYQNIQTRAMETLAWAGETRKWQQFQGISFDCEQEDYPQSRLNRPGLRPLFPGRLIPESWKAVKRAWYWMNEQDPTLFKAAARAYDAVFARAASMGKKIYVVLGPSDFSEYIDGDQDHHANPALPLSSRANVLYGQMSYQDSRPKGRFSCYRDCVDQIRVLGDRGRSILLGWIAQGSDDYTGDEQGFQRYVEDCQIAQAAGMTEIFHAPLYGVQHQWGDQAVWRLHEALNEGPKPRIRVKVRQFTNFFFWDLYENINEVGWMVFAFEALCIATFVARKRRQKTLHTRL